MTLQSAVETAISATGLSATQWAKKRAKIPKSTFQDLMRTGTCSGRTLAKLQRAHVVIADRRLINSLDVA